MKTILRSLIALSTAALLPLATYTSVYGQAGSTDSATEGLESRLTEISHLGIQPTLTNPHSSPTSSTPDKVDLLSCIKVDILYYCPFQGWGPKQTVDPNHSAYVIQIPEGMGHLYDTLNSDELTLADLLELPSDDFMSLLKLDVEEALAGAISEAAEEYYIQDLTPSQRTDPRVVAEYTALNTLPGQSRPASSSEFTPNSVHVVANRDPLYARSLMFKQKKSYYCGPATVAMMAANNPGSKKSADQNYWAKRLGTTTSGTSLQSIVRVVNADLTGWTKRNKGYRIHNISGWSNENWRNAVRTNVGKQGAPIILHPRVNSSTTKYYSGKYDAKSHYTALIGFQELSNGFMTTAIAEPWNGGDGSLKSPMQFLTIEGVAKQNMANTNHRTIAK